MNTSPETPPEGGTIFPKDGLTRSAGGPGFLINASTNPHSGIQDQDNGSYQCHHCGKSYARLDHIKRHYRSHENKRHYSCYVCSKAFNRKDLLDRHRAIHGFDDKAAEKRSTQRNRITKACPRCVSAKTKCSDERPCQRCRDRGETCLPDSPNSSSLPSSSLLRPENLIETSSEDTNAQQPHRSHQDGKEGSTSIEGSRSQRVSTEKDDVLDPTSMDVPLTASQPSFQWLATDGGGFPSIWDSSFLSNDSILNIDDDTLMSMNLDWNSLIQPEQSLQSHNAGNASPAHLMPVSVSANSARSCVLSGHEAFKRSVWLWDPDPHDSAFLEETPQLSQAEESLILSPGSDERIVAGRTSGYALPMRLTCGSDDRDALLLLVQQNSNHAVVVRSFPSSKALSFLLKTFIVHESVGPCSFVHIPSLAIKNCRTELLSAFVVAGSACSANHQIWKFGMALQERTRLAIYKALDYNNSIARNLDIIQAQLLWIGSGLWSGHRRKMEVAESAANNIPTMIRRSGAFHMGYYENTSSPTLQDSGESLRIKWAKWVELESFKRCVFRAVVDDVQSSVSYMRSPCFYSTEITFTLPAPRRLWDAPDPVAWRALYLSRSEAGSLSKPTLLDVIQNPSILQRSALDYNCELSLFVALHCLWPQLAGFLDSKSLHQGNQSSQKFGQNVMWLEAQRQDLYKRLADMRDTMKVMGALNAEAHMVCELFMMTLFVSPADIQKLAGQFGVKESCLTLPNLQAWSDGDEPRYAMWHAGQVLKAAQFLKPTQLRGFYAIAIYQACLTLALPFLLGAIGLSSSRGSPEPDNLRSSASGQTHALAEHDQSADPVILNGPESMLVKTYLLTGQGSPALQIGKEIKVLSNVGMIPGVIADVFGGNHSTTVDRLPPLLEKLVILVGDLARLTGR